MTIRDWAIDAHQAIRYDGLAGLKPAAYDLYLGALRRVPNPGTTHIFDREWDVLVLLDCCRVDLLEEVADDFDFLPAPPHQSITSVGSSSVEWMTNTFTTDVSATLSETIYVTGNPNAANQLSPDSFKSLYNLWQTDWDDGLSTVAPRPITDAAISVGRSEDYNRLILHYMQPHMPFIAEDLDPRHAKAAGSTVGELMTDDGLSADDVRTAHLKNLRHVLTDIELLRTNLDADRLIISADHGQSFGEWGIYGHPSGYPIPQLRRVPWVAVDAADTETHNPTNIPSRATLSGADATRLSDRLRDLGYVT